jgi:hypothetical protein
MSSMSSAPANPVAHVEVRTMKPLAMRMIAPGHFMNQRYFGFGRPIEIDGRPEKMPCCRLS